MSSIPIYLNCSMIDQRTTIKGLKNNGLVLVGFNRDGACPLGYGVLSLHIEP
jgi:hypothetical protein